MRLLLRLGFGALVLAACGKNNYALVETPDGGATEAGADPGGGNVAETGAPAVNGDGGTTPDATTPDATLADADMDADAADAAPPACNLSAPFGAPVMVFGVSSGFTAATLSADETIIVVTGYGPQEDQDLFIATRSKPTSAFGTPARISGLSTVGADEEALALAPDGLTLYFQRQISDGGTTSFTTFRAERASVTADFGTAAPTFGTARIDSLFVAASERVYAGVFNAGTLDDLEVETESAAFAAGPFSTLNSGAYEVSAALPSDERTVYFTSTRAGDDVTDFENADIYVATRTSATAAFGAPTTVPELESARADVVNWLSPDGCRLYFTSDRGVDLGDVLYLATKPAN